MNCDGNCDDLLSEGCSGNVKKVVVRSTAVSPDPNLIKEHRFNYCDTAIKKDRENGYEVSLYKS